ncbi:unnamed protein product [Boreogadus saida]
MSSLYGGAQTYSIVTAAKGSVGLLLRGSVEDDSQRETDVGTTLTPVLTYLLIHMNSALEGNPLRSAAHRTEPGERSECTRGPKERRLSC